MNKRIRYWEREPNLFVSVRMIETDKGPIRIEFNTSNMVVNLIKASEKDVILDTFTAPNHFVMKRQIKEKLIAMGAKFGAEKRNRGANETDQPVEGVE